MKYLETKHQQNSAIITTLLMLIIVVLCFVVGQTYMDPPEEYGVALNFDGSSMPLNSMQPQPAKPNSVEEPTPIEEQQESEEEVNEEIVEDKTVDKQVEDEAEEQVDEDLLAQKEAEALELKEAEEAAKRAEKEKAKKDAKAAAEKRLADAKAKAKAAADAKAVADAKAAADKAAADAKAAAKRAKFTLNQVPVIYPGCEVGDNKAKEKCTRNALNRFVSKNFNIQVAENIELKGIQSIMIVFDIDTNGKAVGIRAQANKPELVNEAKRVTALLPKLRPAMQQGKPTKVKYRLPIKIKIQ